MYLGMHQVRMLSKNYTTKIQKLQNNGKRKWEVLSDICPRNVFETFYLKDRQHYDMAALRKKYGFTETDCKTLRQMYTRTRPIDCFSCTVTEQIYEADNYACRRCGFKEEQLYTYHIIPGGGNNFENGITLCFSCYHVVRKRKMVPNSYRTNRNYWTKLILKYKLYKYSHKRQQYIREYGENPR